MGASRYEQELAQTAGVVIRHWARPAAVEGEGGALRAVTFAATAERDGRLVDTGETFTLPADQLFRAIGQLFVPQPPRGRPRCSIFEGGRIAVDPERRTSLPGVWAGGDCAAGGRDLTVVAVEDGKQAAAVDQPGAPGLRAHGGGVGHDPEKLQTFRDHASK